MQRRMVLSNSGQVPRELHPSHTAIAIETWDHPTAPATPRTTQPHQGPPGPPSCTRDPWEHPTTPGSPRTTQPHQGPLGPPNHTRDPWTTRDQAVLHHFGNFLEAKQPPGASSFTHGDRCRNMGPPNRSRDPQDHSTAPGTPGTTQPHQGPQDHLGPGGSSPLWELFGGEAAPKSFILHTRRSP